jgi:hypothetical protein
MLSTSRGAISGIRGPSRVDLKAIVCAGLGHRDESFGHLDKAFAERAAWMPFLKVDPLLDRLRDDKRFKEMLMRVGIAS